MRYKTMLRRLNYRQNAEGREVRDVVKGVAKRVIVVKSPDPRVFEEAIFIVREDYMKTAGVTRAQLLNEARQAAGAYTGSLRTSKLSAGLVAAISTLIGSGAAALIMYLIM